jgi:putative membrane protein insertion efficiency factor
MKKVFSFISNLIKTALIGVIRFYRRFISPAKAPCCRFYPTCSQYAIDAISKHGAVKGTGMAVWRVLRCNPSGKSGYDPVK